jgi:hypothetical protein
MPRKPLDPKRIASSKQLVIVLCKDFPGLKVQSDRRPQMWEEDKTLAIGEFHGDFIFEGHLVDEANIVEAIGKLYAPFGWVFRPQKLGAYLARQSELLILTASRDSALLKISITPL